MPEVNQNISVTCRVPLESFEEMASLINISADDTTGISEYLAMHGLPDQIASSIDPEGLINRLNSIDFVSIEKDMSTVSIIFREAIDESNSNFQILFTDIENELAKIDKNDRGFDIHEFMKLFFKINQEINNNATTLNFITSRKKITELKSSRDELIKEGESSYKSEINKGIFTGFAGLSSLGGGIYSSRLQIKSAFEAARAERFENIARNIKNQMSIRTAEINASPPQRQSFQHAMIRQEITALNRDYINNLNSSVGPKQLAANLSAESSKAMVKGRFGDTTLSTSGTFAGAEFSRQATDDRVDQNEHQAYAAEAEEYTNIAKNFAQQNQETARILLQFQQTITQAQSQAERTVLHLG